jgi:glycerate 2-kinase
VRSAGVLYRVLVAPDSFGGTMSALEAGDAIASGWRSIAASDVVTVLPMSDGGPGFVDALHAGLRGQLIDVEVGDPLGRPVAAQVLVVEGDGGRVAYLESAQACGLHLLSSEERDPSRTSTAGVATLLLAALDAGADRIVVGLGGSATNDGGAGMLAALGAHAARLRHVDLVAATDVENPLLGPTGATAVFAAQKGATPQLLPLLEERLARFADETAPELAALPGAGAAGGLGYALFTLGGHRVSGADLVIRALDVAGRVAASDLVITGEGSLDAQSIQGKAPVRIAAVCREVAVPCVALAGRVTLGRQQLAAAGFAEAHALERYCGSAEVAIREGAAALRGLAAQVAASWRVAE